MPPVPSFVSLTALALLAPGALRAHRLHQGRVLVRSGAGAPGLRGLVSGADSICGGPDIWSLVTGDPSVEGVQNIKWGKIHALTETHIASEEANLQTLQVQLEGLKLSIEKALAQEEAKPISLDAIRGLVRGAMGPFGGLEAAERTACGRPGLRPRVPRGSFQRGIESFRASAAEIFQGEVRLVSGQAVVNECLRMLKAFPDEEDDTCGPSCQEGSYCQPLCQRLRDEAQELSDATAGAGAVTSSADLRKEQQDALDALLAAQESIAQCKEAQGSLLAFQSQLEGLKSGIDQRFAAVREASFALDDAMYDLEDVTEAMASEMEAMNSTVLALEAAGVSVAGARASVEALQDQEQGLGRQISASQESLENVRRQLQAAEAADNAAAKLRSAVSAVALKMHLFFDKAVLDPTRRTGLTEALNASAYFPSDPKVLDTAGVVRQAIRSFDHFCKTDAKRSFEAVKDDVDLSPLCDFGNACHVNMELAEAVKGRVDDTKEAIAKVQSWFDPYKGQPGITAEAVAAYVAQGEPAGIREIVSVYQQAPFFRKYLKGWLFKGKFLALMAKLKDVIGELEQAFAKLTEDIAGFQEQHEQAAQAREGAQQALGEAVRAHDLEATRKAELERTLQRLQERDERLRKQVTDLEAQLLAAREKYEQARKSLLSAHEEGTSFLETLSESEMTAAEKMEAQRQIAALQDDLAAAQRALRAADSRVVAAERG